MKGSFPLVDDFRNQVQAVFDRWCDGLVGLAIVALGHDVCTQALAGFQWVGERLDTIGIHRLHFVDQPENAVEGRSDVWKIGIIEAKAGQMSDFFHVGAFKRHWDSPVENKTDGVRVLDCRNTTALLRSYGRDCGVWCTEKRPI